MDWDTRKRFARLFEKGVETKIEQIRILRKCQYHLLDEIHGKRQALDQLAYLTFIWKKQKK